jgi:hypothetical protein
VQHVQVTDDRVGVVGTMADRLANDPDVMLDAPYLWVGSLTEIVERAEAARHRWGFDYFVTRSLDATAPVIAALR